MTSKAQSTDHPAVPAAEAVRGLLRQYIERAIELLDKADQEPERSVHSFRKQMKRLRANIRLLSQANGLDLRFIEHSCRDVARQLSALRDLDVMIASLKTYRGNAWPAGMGAALRAAREAELARGVLGASSRRDMLEQLRKVDEAIAALSLEHIEDEGLQRALRRTHKKSLHAYASACEASTDEHFHDLRKLAKRELYQRELLEQTMKLPHPERTRHLKSICDELGDQQDIAVIRGKAEETGFLSPLLDKWLVKRRDRVRHRTLKHGSTLYD